MAKKTSFDLKVLLLIVFAFIAVSVVLYNISFEEDISHTTTTSLQTTTTTLKEDKGTLVVAFKDEDHKIPGGATVKTMSFKVTSVDILSNITSENGTEQWISIMDSEKSLDLLQYTDTYAKIAEKEIDSGIYKKIRIGFSDGTISIINSLLGIYNPKFYDLIVPEETTFDYLFSVEDGNVFTLVVDYDIETSVTRTADGYRFDPKATFSGQAGYITNIEDI